MVKLNIICPKCSKNRFLTINKDQIQFKDSGLFSLNIDENFTCEHSYIAYLDRQFNIRDYFNFDYDIELPEIIPEEEPEKVVDELAPSYDFDIVKMNLTANIITIIIKAIISKKPILIIREKNIYYDNIIPFFKEITKRLFEFEMELIPKDEYKKFKSKYKRYIVLDTSTVLKNPYDFIDIKKLKIEKRIINTFIDAPDASVGITQLRNHIKNARDLARIICEFIENQEMNQNIYIESIVDHISFIRGTKITPQYLDFLMEIVNEYFDIPIKFSKWKDSVGYYRLYPDKYRFGLKDL
ncbi:MAG: hypothetical protein ACFFC3_10090 [Candidatus Odinarchaeota archaeon]